MEYQICLENKVPNHLDDRNVQYISMRVPSLQLLAFEVEFYQRLGNMAPKLEYHGWERCVPSLHAVGVVA